MRHALHYFVEFLVILLGISVSVFIEKDNARVYKEEIKDDFEYVLMKVLPISQYSTMMGGTIG